MFFNSIQLRYDILIKSLALFMYDNSGSAVRTSSIVCLFGKNDFDIYNTIYNMCLKCDVVLCQNVQN